VITLSLILSLCVLQTQKGCFELAGFANFFSGLYEKFSWMGGSQSRYGDSHEAIQLPTIDDAVQGEYAVDTTVDCYVTGTYIDSKGRLSQIKQRYSIRVKYSKSSYERVMSALREKIAQEFTQKYSGYGFDITNVFIPDLLVPKEPQPVEEYKGSRYWKLITRVDMNREMDTARTIYRSRIKGIIKRYSIRRP
jgi:hypothetical protein